MAIDVSIIIPVSRDVAGLESTLRSIRAGHHDPLRTEIIVCNDGGADAVSVVAARHGCIEARLEKNQGSYAARNAGLLIARGSVMAFVDADQTVAHDWLDQGKAALAEADYVGGRVLLDAGPGSNFWERVDAAFAFPVEHYLQQFRFAPTANLFVKRAVFRRLGGFNESLRSGGDREFGARVAAANFIQRYCGHAVTIHPPRGLKAQLQKARRTARGTAHLEVLCWGRSPLRLAAKGLLLAPARMLKSLRHFLKHLGGRHPAGKDANLLAGSRALVECSYYFFLAASAVALVLHRQRFQARIPDIA